MEYRGTVAASLPSNGRGRRARRRGASSRPRRRFGVVGTALSQLVVSGLVALLLVGGAQALIAMRISQAEAVSDARDVTEVLGRSLIAPLLTDGVLHDDPVAIAALDDMVRNYLLNDRVVRIKIWTIDGRIVYSDEPRLIGIRAPLGAEDLEALQHGLMAAEVTDLTAAENVYERGQGKLLEVYMPLHTTGGEPLLFELYMKFASVDDGGRRIWWAFLPVMGLWLLLLELIQAPLAWSLGRHMWRSHSDRERLLKRAIEASDSERRRIAAELHDGIIQDLVGLSYTLAGVANRVKEAGSPELEPMVERAAAGTRRSILELRHLLMDIYPPSVQGAGLEAALSDLLEEISASGVKTCLDLPLQHTMDQEAQGLVFRVCREALQNVRKHSGASEVAVSIAIEGRSTILTVADNRRGFSSEEAEARREEGHLGLWLLRDLALFGGGVLAVESSPGHGTRIRLELPSQ